MQKQLEKNIAKLEADIEDIKTNKIYQNALEWRFEFPEVLNEKGDFVGFDAVIGNPPYIPLEEITFAEKNFFLGSFLFRVVADLLLTSKARDMPLTDVSPEGFDITPPSAVHLQQIPE